MGQTVSKLVDGQVGKVDVAWRRLGATVVVVVIADGPWYPLVGFVQGTGS